MEKLTAFAFLCLLIGLSGCGDGKKAAKYHPPGVRAVMHVDGGTDYVFRDEKSRIGGYCEGWNMISIGPPGQLSGGYTELMCWREQNGKVYTASKSGPSAAPAATWVMIDK